MTMFKPFNKSKLLVHIACHYAEHRINYLKIILDAIDQYDFLTIDVVVDTNIANKINIDNSFNKIVLKYAIHDDLEHPFLLPWQHRENMEKSLDAYDYFMYLEDDILVPYEALLRWKSDSEYLYPAGYLRGFMRVEDHALRSLICVDQTQYARTKDILVIHKMNYYRPPNPYHAFWIYSRHQMAEFVNSPAWKDGNYKDWDVRARAASGMIWRNPVKHDTVIPLDNDYQVPKDVLVWHVSKNLHYAATVFAKIPLNDLIRFGILSRSLLRISHSSFFLTMKKNCPSILIKGVAITASSLRSMKEYVRLRIRKFKAFQRLRKFHSQPRTIDETVEWAMAFGSKKEFQVKTMQVRSEILALANTVAALKPKIILEIGSALGGNLLIWSQLASEVVISCDIEDKSMRRSFYDKFPPKGSHCRIEMLVGDSHAADFRERVMQLLQERKVDFLFIDGDHTLKGVTADYHDYRGLVRPGGLIAFHDIVEKQLLVGNQVHRLWKQLRQEGNTEEFIHAPDQVGFGIGIIRVPG